MQLREKDLHSGIQSMGIGKKYNRVDSAITKEKVAWKVY